MATLIVLVFTAVNLCGLRWAVRVAKPIALVAFALALCSGIIPVLTGHVDWHRAVDFHLTSPFGGAFGHLTSVMAGLYLIGFAAPAFEAAACHIGEMRRPGRRPPDGHVVQRRHGHRVLRPHPGRLAGRLRPATPRGQPGRRPRSDLRPGSSAVWPRPRPSASWPSTCSAAPCSRCRAPPGRCRSCPRTACCPAPSATATRAPTPRWWPSWPRRSPRSPSCCWVTPSRWWRPPT